MRTIDLTGQRFGKLTVIGRATTAAANEDMVVAGWHARVIGGAG